MHYSQMERNESNIFIIFFIPITLYFEHNATAFQSARTEPIAKGRKAVIDNVVADFIYFFILLEKRTAFWISNETHEVII